MRQRFTNDIKQDKGCGKKLWDNINKLRGKTWRSEDIQLLYDINEQPLKISENGCGNWTILG